VISQHLILSKINLSMTRTPKILWISIKIRTLTEWTILHEALLWKRAAVPDEMHSAARAFAQSLPGGCTKIHPKWGFPYVSIVRGGRLLQEIDLPFGPLVVRFRMAKCTVDPCFTKLTHPPNSDDVWTSTTQGLKNGRGFPHTNARLEPLGC